MPSGFKRHDLQQRYDVQSIDEDSWHSYSGERTSYLLKTHVSNNVHKEQLVLNAGAGSYDVQLANGTEVFVDLFVSPIRHRELAVCANIEILPFEGHIFDGIVCVGEVLAYCDPARVISEFGRTIKSDGFLIIDFGNSRSFRYLFSSSYGKAADLVTDSYNGTPEKIWVYDVDYIKSLLLNSGFGVNAVVGTHTWSAFFRRLGVSANLSVSLQRRLGKLGQLTRWSDLTTIVASRVQDA